MSAVDDLHRWLVEQGDWVPLGAADEKKDAAAGTVEAWGRDPDNPVAGWYGLRTGYRGRFGMYLPPLSSTSGWPSSPTTRATTASEPYRTARGSGLELPTGTTASTRLPDGASGQAHAGSYAQDGA